MVSRVDANVRVIILCSLALKGSHVSGFDCDIRIPPTYNIDPELLSRVTLDGCPKANGNPVDYMEYSISLFEQFMETGFHEPKPRADLAEFSWYAIYSEFFRAGVSRGSDMDAYRPNVAVYIGDGGEVGTLDPGDEAALRVLLGKSKVPYCESSNAICGLRDGRLRVVAIGVVLRNRDYQSSLTALSQLSELEALSLLIMHTRRLPQTLLDILYWPRLKNFELVIDPGLLARPQALFGETVGRHTALQSLHIMPGKYIEFDFDLAAYCGLTNLRQLMLPDMNIYKFPQCFGKLRELRHVYVPCNYLTAAPVELAGLPELRHFVGFRQGEYTPCHLQDEKAKNLRNLRKQELRHGDCKTVWETAIGVDSEGENFDNSRVLCPWVSLRGTLEDWLKLGWPKLEKLWLDGNFIEGTLPYSLPEVWPNLTSLDLYENELSGAIPSSFGAVRWEKLQLQGNRLSGVVPLALFETGACYFNIAANSGLIGCIPGGRVLNSTIWNTGIPGTAVTACSEEL